MIQEQYVSFETAKLLKEKGFNWQCPAYYSEYFDNWKTLRFWKCGKPKTYDTVRNSGYLLVPTQSMAVRWLREVHNIFISPRIQNDGTYICYLYDTKGNGIQGYDKNLVQVSYEQACEATIKYCLENLI